MGYFMPKPCLQDDSSDTNQHIAGVIWEWVRTFPKSISPRLNLLTMMLLSSTLATES